MKIEVPVTTIGQSDRRTYEWDCPLCNLRSRSGKHGIDKGCVHEVTLKARNFSDIVAVYEK